jgi:hypothetical protein
LRCHRQCDAVSTATGAHLTVLVAAPPGQRVSRRPERERTWASASSSARAMAMSNLSNYKIVREIHNQAHVEFLPVQHIEDQSLIFTEAER